MQGYIKIHRKIDKWRWRKCPNTFYLWVHMLLAASYKNTYDGFGNEIPAGSFSSSVRKLAKDTGLSVGVVRTCLDRLKNDTQISTRQIRNCTLFSIVNWSEYQCNNTGDNTATTQQQHNNKKVKKEKNIYSAKFENEIETIYKNHYPNKRGKTGGIKKLAKEIKDKETLAIFEKAVIQYAHETNNCEKKYIKHFSTFASCWRDYLNDEIPKKQQKIIPLQEVAENFELPL